MIREATHTDYPAIIAMGAVYHAASDYVSRGPYCPDSARRILDLAMASGVVLVIETAAGLIGMAVFIVAPFMFGGSVLAANEVVWWIDPRARMPLLARRLLLRAESDCIAQGARSIQLHCLAGGPRAVVRIYRRMGYVHSETCFTKEL